MGDVTQATGAERELAWLSAAEIGRAVRAGEVSPSEVVDYFARRIEERNESLNAFVYTRLDHARKEARRLERRLLAGEEVGPFAGVPFGLKDFLPSKRGWQNSHGGVKALIATDTADSTFCRAMEAAGGIALGKTNAPAFGFRGTTDNLLYGPTRNPFDARYNSGGSSGGSAAAVADGMIPIAEGGDAGGSIRIPAAWCGCFGYRASVGTIASVARPDAWSATHPYCFNGGITKTVEDAAILLNHMASYDPRDPLSARRPDVDYTEAMRAGIEGKRIAYTPDFGIFPTEPEVTRVVGRAARRLEEAGATVEGVEFHFAHSAFEISETWCLSICIDTAIELELGRRQGFDLVRDHADDVPRDFVRWNERAAAATIMDYYDFNCVRTEILDELENVLDDYDYIVSPTTVCLSVPNAEDRDTRGPSEVAGVPTQPLIGFAETFLTNFTGHPSASVPAGLSEGGLPVGMQIIGHKHRDGELLAAARAFEEVAPWRDAYRIPFARLG